MHTLFIFGFLFMFCAVNAQVDGLWQVKKVMVGDKDRTPVARWFRLDGGKQTSGNGWQQHSFGTYQVDKKKSQISFQTDNEPSDGAGAFNFERKGNSMTWSRIEEGTQVVVELELISELPMSVSDKIKGLWGLRTVNQSNITHAYDPTKNQFLFIRWDRVYVRKVSDSDQARGNWFVDAHKPELKLVGTGTQGDEVWAISFDHAKLILTGLSENVKGLVLSFEMMSEFPK